MGFRAWVSLLLCHPSYKVSALALAGLVPLNTPAFHWSHGLSLVFLFSVLRREVVTLAFVAGALLAGLGVDYVIYVTLREFTEPGGPSTAAVLNAIRATGRPILFAALTTAAAFFAFPLTGERFLVDLGLLSGLGILACMAASVILLPALLSPWARRGDRGGYPDEERAALRPRDLGAGGLASFGLRFPRASLFGSALLSLGSLACLVIKPPEVEVDLLNVHIGSSEAVRVQEEIAATFGGAKVPLLILVEGDPAKPAGGGTAPEPRQKAGLERRRPSRRRLGSSPGSRRSARGADRGLDLTRAAHPQSRRSTGGGPGPGTEGSAGDRARLPLGSGDRRIRAREVRGGGNDARGGAPESRSPGPGPSAQARALAEAERAPGKRR